jgi:hypothetical protein
MKNHSWPMILKFGSEQLFLVAFCRVCHIRGTLLHRKGGFFESFQGILDFSKLGLCCELVFNQAGLNHRK